MGEATAHAIRMKAAQYWRLWDEFSTCLLYSLNIDAMALLELPNGCDYWRDDRMMNLLDGTDVHDHRFDGCMYGLRTTYCKHQKRLKKPWRVISWGVSFPSLREQCDGKHDHGKCEGRETKLTQEYTEKMIRIIMSRVNRESVKRMGGAGRSQNPCHMSDEQKEYHSFYTESPRSPKSALIREKLLRCPDPLGLRNGIGPVACVVSASSREAERLVTLRVYNLVGGPCRDVNWSFREGRVLRTGPDRTSVAMVTTTEPIEGNYNVNVMSEVTKSMNVLKQAIEMGLVEALPPPHCGEHEKNQFARRAGYGWVNIAHINPILVASALFSSLRTSQSDTSPMLGVLPFLFRHATTKDKEMKGSDFITKVSQFSKVWTSKATNEMNRGPAQLLASNDVTLGMPDFAETLKAQFVPTPFNEKENLGTIIANVEAAWAKGHKINFSGPDQSTLLFKTRCDDYRRLMRELLCKRIGTLRDQHGRWDRSTVFYVQQVIQYGNIFSKWLGYALREHNMRFKEEQLIFQDVIKLRMEGDRNLPLWKAAAVNCVAALLGCTWYITEFRLEIGLFRVETLDPVLQQIRSMINPWVTGIIQEWGLIEDIFKNGGFNVMKAEEGDPDAIMDKKNALSTLTLILTTCNDTSGGGVINHTVGNWKTPLMYDDGRLPIIDWNKMPPWSVKGFPNVAKAAPKARPDTRWAYDPWNEPEPHQKSQQRGRPGDGPSSSSSRLSGTTTGPTLRARGPDKGHEVMEMGGRLRKWILPGPPEGTTTFTIKRG